jgi:hypothetical protein
MHFVIEVMWKRAHCFPAWEQIEITIVYIFCKSWLFWRVSSGVWIQGLMLAGQVLYLLNHAQRPFCFGYFEDGGLSFMSGLAWTTILLFIFLCFWDYRCIPHAQLFIGWDGVFGTLLSQTTILQISKSQVVRSIGLSSMPCSVCFYLDRKT